MSKAKPVSLVHRQQFIKLLANYQPNPQVLQYLRQQPPVLLVAPTSSGRNTIIDHLCRHYDYYFLASNTTRPPRVNNGLPEVDGQQYWFKTEQEFLKDLRLGRLIEAALIHDQQVSGAHIDQLKQSAAQKRTPITDMDIQGYQTYRAYKPDIKAIFVLPPSFEQWLDRLSKRGVISKAERQRRLTSASQELGRSLDQPQLSYVVNDDLDEACRQIDRLVKQPTVVVERSEASLRLVRSLLRQLDSWLASPK